VRRLLGSAPTAGTATRAVAANTTPQRMSRMATRDRPPKAVGQQGVLQFRGTFTCLPV